MEYNKSDKRYSDAEEQNIDVSSLLDHLNKPVDMSSGESGENAPQGQYEDKLRRMIDDIENAEKARAQREEAPAEEEIPDDEAAYYAPVDRTEEAPEDISEEPTADEEPIVIFPTLQPIQQENEEPAAQPAEDVLAEEAGEIAESENDTQPEEEPAVQTEDGALVVDEAEKLYSILLDTVAPIDDEPEEEEEPEIAETAAADEEEDEEFDSNYYSPVTERAAQEKAAATEEKPSPAPMAAEEDEEIDETDSDTATDAPEEEEIVDDAPSTSDKLRSISDKVFGIFTKKKSDAPQEDAEQTDDSGKKKKKKFRFNSYIPELDTRFGYRGAEYKNAADSAAVLAAYRQDKLRTDIRIVATALLALVLFVFDTFGSHFGGALSAAAYPSVQILVSLQILLIAAAFSYRQLWAGFHGLFTGKPNTSSVMSAAIAIVVTYDVILACAGRPGFTLYNFPAALTLLFVALRDHLLIANEKRNFEKLSGWKNVYTLENADRVESGDAKLKRTFRLHGGNFAENYFAHTNRWDSSLKIVTILICISLAASLLVFIIMLAAHKNSALELINTFVAQVLFTLPAFAVVASIYPFYALMFRDRAGDCVVLSEPDAQEYASVGTLVINEDDFFGKDGSIYVKQMKLCTSTANNNIYDIIPAAYSILRAVGATAAAPIARMIEKLEQDTPEVDDIRSITEDGICGVVGGKTYYIGTEQYLADNGIRPLAISTENSGSACRRMHIASETEDLIVYELVYSLKRKFVANLVKLSNQGIRIVVRATDPNIDEHLMRTLTGKIATPIRVRKNTSDPSALLDSYRSGLEEDSSRISSVDGGILANGDKLNDLIDRANICAGYKKWSGVNIIAIGIAFGIGLILSILLGVNGLFVNMLSIFIVLYQLIALVPSVIIAVSKVFL